MAESNGLYLGRSVLVFRPFLYLVFIYVSSKCCLLLLPGIVAYLDHWLTNVSLLHFAAHWEVRAIFFLPIRFRHGAFVEYEINHMGSFYFGPNDCHYL